MAKEYLDGRVHGDGSLKLEKTVGEDERGIYFQALQKILTACDLKLNLNRDEEDEIALALKQRIALGFSNGCPQPEGVTIEFIQEQKEKPTTANELVELILESGRADAQCNVLYQKILKFANRTLRSELMLLKPTEEIDGREDHNLPSEMTENQLIAGMAFEPVFFDVLVPLRDFINEGADQQEAFNQVVSFLKSTSQEVTSIEELVERTKSFESN